MPCTVARSGRFGEEGPHLYVERERLDSAPKDSMRRASRSTFEAQMRFSSLGAERPSIYPVPHPFVSGLPRRG